MRMNMCKSIFICILIILFTLPDSLFSQISKNENPSLEQAMKLLSDGKGSNIKEYFEYLKNDEEKLKWLFENSDKEPRVYYRDIYKKFAINNIKDNEFLLSKIDDLKFDSELWKLLISKLSYKELEIIVSSSDHNLDYKEKVVLNVNDPVFLKSIIEKNESKLIKNAALTNLNDQGYLYEYYIKNNCGFYEYQGIILEKLSDEYLLKIINITDNVEIKKRIIQLLDDQDLLEKYAIEYKDFEIANKIKDVIKRRELFWKIDDDKFRYYFVSSCFGYKDREGNIDFLKGVLDKIKSSEIKRISLSSSFRNSNDNQDVEYLKYLFYNDTCSVVKEEIINIMGSYLHNNWDTYNDNLMISIKDISLNPETDIRVKNKANEQLVRIRKRQISSIKNFEEYKKLILTENNPEILRYLLELSFKYLYDKYYDSKAKKLDDKYQKEINNLVGYYIQQKKILDENIVNLLTNSCSDTELLKRLYPFAVKNWLKISILKKINDDDYLMKIIRQSTQDTTIIKAAMGLLTDGEYIKQLLKEYKNKNEFIEILSWRSSKQILNKLVNVNDNDTLALIKEMRIEILTSNNDNFLDKFFKNWHNSIQPLSNTEFNRLNDFEKDVYYLYELYLLRSFPQGNNHNYIVLPFSMQCYIDTTATESSDPENLKRTKTVNISNFKPFNKIFEGKTLYLDSKYSRVLYSYINYCQIDIKRLESQPDIFKFTGFNDYDTINYYRNMLLNRHISSFRGHWGDNYVLVSHPVVTSITFNKERTIAALAFTSKFEGSSEFYIKKNGKWEYSHKLKGGWIE